MADPNSLERGEAQSTGRFGRVNRGMFKYGVMVAGFAGIAIYAALSDDGEPQMPAVSSAAMQSEITVGQKINAFLPASMVVPPAQPKPVDPPMPAAVLGASANTGAAAPPPRPKRVVSYDTERNFSQETSGPGTAAGGRSGAGAGPAQAQGQQGEGPTSVAYRSSRMQGLRAGPAMNMAYVMRPGIYKMTLVTGINSEREGSFLATLPQPIKSQAGVTLMEEGSTIWGSYKAQVGQGQERIQSVAAWGLTPFGVPVPLSDAAVTDQTGRSGLPGEVNTHWKERIGGAFLLMFSQGAIQAATAALQAGLSSGNGNTFLNLNSGSGPVTQALGDALRTGTAIQNTVDVQPGKEIAFIITAPIDFSDAYSLQPVGASR